MPPWHDAPIVSCRKPLPCYLAYFARNSQSRGISPIAGEIAAAPFRSAGYSYMPSLGCASISDAAARSFDRHERNSHGDPARGLGGGGLLCARRVARASRL